MCIKLSAHSINLVKTNLKSTKSPNYFPKPQEQKLTQIPKIRL